MKVTSKSVILAGAVLFLGTPAMATLTSSGLVGDCVDCHTMHNSEQGAAVALHGTSTTPSYTPNQNLLRMDCIACHANPAQTVAVLDNGGGSNIPQVNHVANGTDLAGGNFAYLAGGNFRKGHNVVELGYGADSDGAAWSTDAYTTPPGMYSTGNHQTGERFTEDDGNGAGFLKNFTCAGSAGCHGIRNRVNGVENQNTTSGSGGNSTGVDGANYFEMTGRIEGIAAISGAHHNSYDGLKVPGTAPTGITDGQWIANSYRFIPGLKGAGDTTDQAYRWRNVDASHHNEYYGTDGAAQVAHCGDCHNEVGEEIYGMEHVSTAGYMLVPDQSISGFCATCHGAFHSPGTGGNGSSGAFLRHPNDYKLPATGEYTGYSGWEITAPVARISTNAIWSGSAGDDAGSDSTGTYLNSDVVMCLSCHMAHASQYDGMLRFNYETMQAGNATAAADGTGCLACHTTKGTLPLDRP